MLQDSDLSPRAGQLDEKNLYLVHGTADKTVHQQHTMTFAKDLVNKDIVFRQQVRIMEYEEVLKYLNK